MTVIKIGIYREPGFAVLEKKNPPYDIRRLDCDSRFKRSSDNFERSANLLAVTYIPEAKSKATAMNIKITLVLIFSLIAALASSNGVHARSISEDVQELEAPPQERNMVAVRRRRQVFDASCKGVYDRGLWAKLNNACLDCQNIYRANPAIEGECRENCFGTEIFYGCLKALKLPTKTYLYYGDLLRES
ncbi:crustacean hyperglycemic hormones-like [Penaeus japonicus]|uniref:crustacean hyperglycemic hormones-like n=1 Tax=Penaeus japonicus TaxID=27405 RepID=UPI001C7117F5|nr:crustacean hyperglycemic hormones-like [Penaeus japonicus]